MLIFFINEFILFFIILKIRPSVFHPFTWSFYFFYFSINHLQEEISVKFFKTFYSKDWSVHFQMMTAWNHFDCASSYNSYDSRRTAHVKSFLLCMCFSVLETQNGCLVIQAWTIRWLNCVSWSKIPTTRFSIDSHDLFITMQD